MRIAPLHCRWAQEVQEEMAAFPNGEYDDLHDAAVWGLSRIRDGNFVRLASDETEEDWVPHTPRAYY